MKYLLLSFTLLAALNSYGQLTGTVIDKTTRQPISGAIIRLGTSKTITNTSGKFEIATLAIGDSLKITHPTYKPNAIFINKTTAVLLIELEPKLMLLNEVEIHGDRNFKKDSIANRIEYAKQFNYTGPKVMDAFTGKPNKQPGELISINPMLLIAALTKKSTPEYKFNKILLRDEQANYVDRKFNRGNVSRITGLKGDTLAHFLIQYQPSYEFAKKATEYDMVVYIKKSFELFKKEGITESFKK